MRKSTTILGAGVIAFLSQAAIAGSGPVVVELFTSQGCSSCPPADALLADMAGRDGVIALALHVDYWDYIGWEDTFAQARFTERQKAYAHAAKERSIFTPQFIVGGSDRVVGADAMTVMEQVMHHAESDMGVDLQASRQGNHVAVRATTRQSFPSPLDVQVVRVMPSETVAIPRGENAGQEITYSNIVTDWQKVGVWDGQGDLAMDVAVPGDAPWVVILQAPGPGAILAAASSF